MDNSKAQAQSANENAISQPTRGGAKTNEQEKRLCVRRTKRPKVYRVDPVSNNERREGFRKRDLNADGKSVSWAQ